MYDLFFTELNKKLSLTSEEQEFFAGYLIPKKLRKKQFVLQEGDACKYVTFVEKGMLRSYAIDDKGAEKVFQFAPEGWWISDMYSFITGEPATLSIDALEDTELVLISKSSLDELRDKIPSFMAFSLNQIQSAYIALQRRLFDMVNLNTAEKYSKLVSTYPDIVQRVPQHMIASYLGLTPEALSRVRRRIAEGEG
jgi:CRP-like cAMP-binding protein